MSAVTNPTEIPTPKYTLTMITPNKGYDPTITSTIKLPITMSPTIASSILTNFNHHDQQHTWITNLIINDSLVHNERTNFILQSSRKH